MACGEIQFVSNSQSPITSYNGTINFTGTDINFHNNAGVLYSVRSLIMINGVSCFCNNSIKDNFNDGTLAIQEITLVLGGMYNFTENKLTIENGGAIYATIKSLIIFSGIGIFYKNKANYGVQYSSINCQELKLNTKLNFILSIMKP